MLRLDPITVYPDNTKKIVSSWFHDPNKSAKNLYIYLLFILFLFIFMSDGFFTSF